MKKLNIRLLIAFTLLVIIPIIAAGLFISYQTRSIQIAQAFENQNQMAQRVKTEFQSYIRHHEESLLQLITVRGFAGVEPGKIEKLIEGMQVFRNKFEEITLIDDQGNERVRYHRFRVFLPRDLQNRASSTFFKETRSRATSYFGPVHFNSETGEPLIQISVPYFEIRSNRFKGLLVGELRLKPIWDLLAAIDTAPGQQVYILDSEKRVIAHANPSIVLRGTKFSAKKGIFTQGIDDIPVVIALQTVSFGERDFTIVAELSEKETLRFANQTFQLILLLGVLSLFMVAILIVLLLRQFVYPVRRLVEVARAIEQGDTSCWAEIDRADEVGELAHSFNQMIARLQLSLKNLKKEVSEHEQAKKDMQALVGSTVGSIGEDFFTNTVEKIYDWLKSDCVVIGEIVDDSAIKTLAVMRNGERFPDYTVALVGTPSEMILKNGFQVFSDNVSDVFPADKKLLEMGTKSYMGTPIKDKTGHPIGILYALSCQKLTISEHGREVMDVIAARTSAEIERKRLEEGKIQLETHLRQAQKMEAVGTLAGGIAHDFNNILSAIFGYAELAQVQLDDPKNLRRDIKQILKGAIRAKELVKQILTFSRKGEQGLKPLRVQVVVKEVSTLLRSSIPSTIEIKQNIDPDCPSVLADPTQIHQIITNLCTNAYHAMRDTGGILGISLSLFDLPLLDNGIQFSRSSGSYLKLEISDTGHGMTRDIRDKIFDPYFTTKGKGEGTGMGLAVVHGIVRSFQGDITVYSEPGTGTTFNVYLPVIEMTKDLGEEVELTTAIPTGHERILMVDDDEIITDLNKLVLTRLGYNVTALTSSVETLDLFQRDPDAFDLIITDMTMPKMTGAELATEMMTIRSDIPIILCTGHSDLINEEKAKEIGIKDYIMKPVSQKGFANSIRNVLDQEKSVK